MAANNAPVSRVAVVQAGVEVTAGTAVAATRVIDMTPGGASFTPTHDPILVGQAGDLSENVYGYAGLTGVGLMVPMSASYDDLPWWWNTFATPVTSPTNGGTATITAMSAANPTHVTTSGAHGLTTGDTTTLAGTNTTPSADGSYTVTVIDTTHFTVPFDATGGAGTSGTCTKPPYTYAGAPNASSDDPKRITFEIGGVGSPAWPSEYQLAGCTGTKLEFDFQKQALWGIKATYAGMVVVDQSKTAALSARTVHHIRTIDTRAYLNGTGSAFGNTELASRVISGSLTYENGGDPRQVWSGSGAPSMVALVGPQKVSGKLRLHFSANTEKVSWIGATAQRLRIAATGSALGAGNYSATIDVGVELTKWTPVADKGLIAVDVEFKGMKDSSLGSQIKITTLNDIALQP